MDIPYEIWEKIAFYDVGTFNILARAIPKLGRKTLNPKFQNYIIETFNLYQLDDEGDLVVKVNGKLHSIYDRPAIIWSNGRSWCKDGIVHRDNGPAIIYANGHKWWQNGSQKIKS